MRSSSVQNQENNVGGDGSRARQGGNASSMKVQDGKENDTSTSNSDTNVNGTPLGRNDSYSMDRYLGSNDRRDDPSPWLRKT